MVKLSGWLPTPGPQRTIAYATFVNTVGTGLFGPIGVLFFTESVGLSTAQVGLGLTIGALVGLLAGIPIGHLADRRGPRGVYAASLVGGGLAMAAYLLVQEFWAFVVVACVMELVGSAGQASRDPLIRAFGGATPVRFRAYLRSVTNLGLSLGAIAAGLALNIDSWIVFLAPVLGNAVSYLACAVTILRVPRLTPMPRPPGARRWQAASDRPFVVITALNGIMALRYSVLSFAIPLWVVHYTDAPKWIIAASLVSNTVLVVLFQVRASRGVEGAQAAGRAMRTAGFVLFAAFGLIAVTAGLTGWQSAVVLLGAVMVYTVGELRHAAAAFELSFGLAPAHAQGQYSGLFGLGQGLARSAAPSVLGLLCLTWGAAGWLTLGAVMVGVGLLMPAATRWAERSREAMAEDDFAADSAGGELPVERGDYTEPVISGVPSARRVGVAQVPRRPDAPAADRPSVLLLGADRYVMRACEQLGVDATVLFGPGARDNDLAHIPSTLTAIFTEDHRSLEAVLGALHRAGLGHRRFDGIQTSDERALVTAAVLAQMFRCRFISPQHAIGFRDKSVQKERVRAAGIPVARSAVIDDIHHVDEVEWTFERAVLKPIAGAGTSFTTIVSSIEDVRAASVAHRRRRTGSRTFLLEEFVEGQEWTVDGVVLGGELMFYGLGDYGDPCLSVLIDEKPLRKRKYDPVSEAAAYTVAEPVVRGALQALGMTDGVFHMELFYDRRHNLAVFGECAARRGGGLTPEEILCKFNVDLGKVALEVSLGWQPQLDVKIHPAVVGSTTFPRRPGTLVSCPTADEICALRGVEFARIELPFGFEMAESFSATSMRIGHALLVAASPQQLSEDVTALTAWFDDRTVVVPPGLTPRDLRSWANRAHPETSPANGLYAGSDDSDSESAASPLLQTHPGRLGTRRTNGRERVTSGETPPPTDSLEP